MLAEEDLCRAGPSVYHRIFLFASLLCIPSSSLTGNSVPGKLGLQTGSVLRNFFHAGTLFAWRESTVEIFTTAGADWQDIVHVGGVAGSAPCLQPPASRVQTPRAALPACLPACGESGLTAGPDSPNPDSSTPRPTSRTLTGVRESENQLWAAGF